MRGHRYARDFARYARRNYLLLALAGAFLLGVSLGVMYYRSAGAETLDMLGGLIRSFSQRRASQSLAANTAATALSSLMFLGFLLVCGFCAVAQPVIVLAPLFRGLGFGFSAASLYAAYGMGAAGYIALFIFPDMLLSSLAILLCGREALRLSVSFWRAMRGSEGRYPLRVYLGRFAAAAVLCVLSAVLAALLHFVFANHVVLG